MVLRRYRHTSPLAFAVRCPAVLYAGKPICPRHPGLLLGSHQMAGGYQLHGHLTPGRISVGCPHCLRRFFHARAVTGQEYHCPHCLSWPYREPPGTSCGLLSLPATEWASRKQVSVTFRCLHPIADHRAATKLAYAHRNDSGNVSDEWVFDFQVARPFTAKRKTGEDFLSSPVS